MKTFSHTVFDTRFGPAAIAVTARGVIRLDLPASDPDDLVADLVQATGSAPAEDDGPAGDSIEAAVEAVGSFLEGESAVIDVTPDWTLVSGFSRRVLQSTMEIPYGKTRSYGEIALEAGSPLAHRAAGTALSRNPIALVVPCHRVIRGDGHPGGYGRGKEGRRLKMALLDLEAERVRRFGSGTRG